MEHAKNLGSLIEVDNEKLLKSGVTEVLGDASEGMVMKVAIKS